MPIINDAQTKCALVRKTFTEVVPIAKVGNKGLKNK